MKQLHIHIVEMKTVKKTKQNKTKTRRTFSTMPSPKLNCTQPVSYMLSHNYLIFLIHSFEVILISKLLFIHTHVKGQIIQLNTTTLNGSC